MCGRLHHLSNLCSAQPQNQTPKSPEGIGGHATTLCLRKESQTNVVVGEKKTGIRKERGKAVGVMSAGGRRRGHATQKKEAEEGGALMRLCVQSAEEEEDGREEERKPSKRTATTTIRLGQREMQIGTGKVPPLSLF